MKRKLLVGVAVLGLIACGDKNNDANQIGKNTLPESTQQATARQPDDSGRAEQVRAQSSAAIESTQGNKIEKNYDIPDFSGYPGAQCKLTANQLSDPDQTLNLYLEGSYCNNVYASEAFYESVLGKYISRPTNKIEELEQKYGHLNEDDFAGWNEDSPSHGIPSQGYKEFKVLDKKQADPILGLNTIKYTVELLYSILEGYSHVPGSINGLLPACERNTATIYALDTPGGWYIVGGGDIGINIYHELAIYRSSIVYKNSPRLNEKYLQTKLKIASECTDKLN